MALMTAIRPAATGTTWSLSAVASSDTISANDLGANGAYLFVANASGSTITVTITDAGLTDAGSAATNPTVSVTTGTTKAIFISRFTVNNSTGVTTVSYSATTSVTSAVLAV